MRRWEGCQDLHSTGLLGVVEAEQLLLSADHIILAGGTHANHYLIIKQYPHTSDRDPQAYLIIVIFFTLTQFLENKIYTEKRQFFALNL